MLRFSTLLRCAAAEPVVLFEQKGKVGLITLNRPKALNALNRELSEAMVSTLLKYDKDPSIHCFVLTGAGRAFIAGADIKMMKDMGFADWHNDNAFAVLEKIREVRKPIVAACNGFTLGGGCEVAMMCDFIIASDKAVFGQPEIKLGVIPGIGGTQRLTRAIGKAKAMDWVLTGENHSAEEAERAGLVSRVVKHEELIPTAMKVAETIASYSTVATIIAKDTVNKSQESSLTEGLAYELRSFHAIFATKDQKEGMNAFAEKRAPVFKNE